MQELSWHLLVKPLIDLSQIWWVSYSIKWFHDSQFLFSLSTILDSRWISTLQALDDTFLISVNNKEIYINIGQANQKMNETKMADLDIVHDG